MEPNRKKMDKLLRATAALHTDDDVTTQESILVLFSLICVIAHETCTSKEYLQAQLEQSYDHISNGAKQHLMQ
jgi:hypothetical protein